MNLNFSEQFVAMSLRTFHFFLLSNHYHLVEVNFQDKDGDGLRFHNNKRDLNIVIGFTPQIGRQPYFEIIFNGKLPGRILGGRKSFSVSKILHLFSKYAEVKPEITKENMGDQMTRYLDFIKDYLMPVINGEKWIDDILKEQR